MCTNTVDCSIRSLWRMVQFVVDRVLSKTTLKDLIHNEQEMTIWADHLVNIPEVGEPASQIGASQARGG